MFGLDDLAEGALGAFAHPLGLVTVVAVALVGGPHARPLAKKAIVGYMAVSQRAREGVAESWEKVQDLYAEARYEYQSQLAGSAIEEPVPSRPDATEQPA